MKVIIDRFEGNFAVCEKEDEEMINIEKSKLPSNSKEGDVLIINGENTTFDEEETNARRERVRKLMDSLWE
ncbi:DUF3006 domain-containing protein [Clostridium swellfunianum]|uniref:DUF3006 domain-containing protein n=1 Tax=Clostridium swellfunianum TaxID=1367462 RepID=UPI00202FF18D|nr:DUF3006 domain-containing protein [Clostridium swellfunianum]MCM0647365.1 DUF3006 domain-containing protein [Clostridium swellfunianum]